VKPVVFQGPFNLQIGKVDKPNIEHPDDIIVKITSIARYTKVEHPQKKV
jgi:threonine dehydrogenase-like Zn-dependent dehydrogenase